MHVGGRPEPVELTDRDREICKRIGPTLKNRGLIFVGIDVIGDYLTEINVTSPTGIRELKRFGGADIAVLVWDAVETKVSGRFADERPADPDQANKYEQFKPLLYKTILNPDDLPLSGASSCDIAAAERKLRRRLPKELKDWLRVVNGPSVGVQGGFLGVNSRGRNLEDVVDIVGVCRKWMEEGWFPVADDGCDNYYVMLSKTEGNPVAFIDMMADPSNLNYVAASNLAQFVRGFIESESGQDWYWPFDKDETLKRDPALATVTIAKLPWDTD